MKKGECWFFDVNGIIINMKTCRKCGNTYPSTYEYFVKVLHWKTKEPLISKLCVYCNRARSREWAKNNPERFRAAQNKSSRKAYANNKELHSKRRKDWERNLSESGKAALRERMRKWTNSRPEQIIRKRINALVWRSLSGNKGGASWESFIGYTLQDLMCHIESRFLDGMSWDNRGLWHIDHIKPLSSFKYKSYDDPAFKECWSLDNLQPLWAKDNLSKGAKIL
jgi:hypothetical protein